MKIDVMDRTSSLAYKENEQIRQSEVKITDLTEVDEKEVNFITESIKTENKQNIVEDAGDLENQASQEHIRSVISKTKQKMNTSTSLEFSYHEATKRVSIHVIDKNTKKVIREIPPEKSLDMLQKMWELAGILVDEKR